MKPLKTFTTDVTINASKEKVWDAMFTRFGEVYLYNPGLDGSHFVKGSKGEVGCERQCDLNSRTKIVERITKAEELKRFTVDIYDGNMPMMDKMFVQIEFVTIHPQRTNVIATAHYSTKPAFMGVLVKGMMKSKLTDMLIGLKYYLETGNIVSKKTYKPIKKSYQQQSFNQSFSFTSTL